MSGKLCLAVPLYFCMSVVLTPRWLGTCCWRKFHRAFAQLCSFEEGRPASLDLGPHQQCSADFDSTGRVECSDGRLGGQSCQHLKHPTIASDSANFFFVVPLMLLAFVPNPACEAASLHSSARVAWARLQPFVVLRLFSCSHWHYVSHLHRAGTYCMSLLSLCVQPPFIVLLPSL